MSLRDTYMLIPSRGKGSRITVFYNTAVAARGHQNHVMYVPNGTKPTPEERKSTTQFARILPPYNFAILRF